jgi:hypothetical protein
MLVSEALLPASGLAGHDRPTTHVVDVNRPLFRETILLLETAVLRTNGIESIGPTDAQVTQRAIVKHQRCTAVPVRPG